jgi:L-asparaginase
MESSAIRILATGGTFDKTYDEIAGQLSFAETHIPSMLSLGRCLLNVTVETLFMVDSLYMTEEQRAQVLERCVSCPESRIVITHGTDSLEVTADLLGRHAPAGKTIVLTGAMIPYHFGSSDGLFNLGGALAFAQAMGPGVYVAMNGRCLEWEGVRKDRARGVFEGENPAGASR